MFSIFSCACWSSVYLAKIFSPILWGFFSFFKMVSFAVHKILTLIRSYWFICVFIVFMLGDGSNKILIWFMSKSILLMFSSRSFIVSWFTFRYLIHFDFIFVYVLDNVLNPFSYTQVSSSSSTIYWRNYLSSTVCSCLLCHRSIDQRHLGLLLGFLSCSIDLYFFFL